MTPPYKYIQDIYKDKYDEEYDSDCSVEDFKYPPLFNLSYDEQDEFLKHKS